MATIQRSANYIRFGAIGSPDIDLAYSLDDVIAGVVKTIPGQCGLLRDGRKELARSSAVRNAIPELLSIIAIFA